MSENEDVFAQVEKAQQTMDEQKGNIQSLVDISQDVSGYATEVLEVVDDIKELSEETSDLSQSGEEKIEEAVDQIEKINEQVQSIEARMETLEEFSQEILSIIGVLKDIASKTHMLSLNASIEAARAGEAGQGFAVVADEVKNLAEDSADSSEEVEELIHKIVEEIEELSTAAESAAQEAEEGKEEVVDSKDTFQAIQDRIIQLKDNNQAVYQKADKMNNISNEVEELSQPIAQNRVIISDGIDAALSLEEE